MTNRKKEHVELAALARVDLKDIDKRFHYEPLLSGHPSETPEPFHFLGKTMNVPLWISSMTGGTTLAKKINRNLAKACREFGLGMGLGSCRKLLDNDTYLGDFDLRDIIGTQQPFFANLGIAQIEKLLEEKRIDKIYKLLEKLNADGLIIHVNPLQEWLQPEGDKIRNAPIETIEKLIQTAKFDIIVKEVGQGMGPESLKRLLQLPVAAIEFGAFGGTNFSKMEVMRSGKKQPVYDEAFTMVGHDAFEMTNMINSILIKGINVKCKHIIISGGINSFLDGYYLINKCSLPAIYGQASAFLKHANESYDSLQNFVKEQITGLQMAKAYLNVK
ncbi:MAG: hypothetical protein KAT48_03520 [Bacteroidales bacterium]|nr:hypothetical protein [Bacteroidales bacterium]